MPKTKAFDEYSDRYDEWFIQNQLIYQTELEAIRQLLPSADVRGMEVGVGSGRFAVPLGIRIGVEPSEKMAVKAEKQGIQVFRSVAEELPFSDCEFDFVLLVTTICFVDDLRKSFAEAFRVLKPCGCIVVGFIDKESELGKQYWAQRQANVFYKEATFYTTSQVVKTLVDSGFINFSFRQTLIPGEPLESIQTGFGKGSFVVIKGEKSG